MPLLGKRPFIRLDPPEQLEPDEELFYCKLTHEVFRDYDGYFERVILCNSLVWTCSLTGRTGLTFQEAVESEAQAQRHLASFPNVLKRPILYLATLTRRGRLADLCDDVFVFARDRFFVGEEVDAVIDGIKKRCTVSKVTPPEKDASLPNKKADSSDKSKFVGLDPQKYKYDVVEKHGVEHKNLPAASVNRVKGSYTREKSKLFVKRNVEPKDCIWKVKDDAIDKYNLNETLFKDIFAGPPPSFETSPKKRIISNVPLDSARVVIPKMKEKEKPSKNTITSKNEGSKNCLVKEKSSMKTEEGVKVVPPSQQFNSTVGKIAEQKLRQKLERMKEKEKRKEEKKLLAEYKQEWKRPRDDLECDDLRELPHPTAINCIIPTECFGDAVMVMEFLHRFWNLVDLKDSFPKGFTLELLERSLTETDIQGPFSHLLQLLLTTIFQLSEEEEQEETDDSLYSSDANDDSDEEMDKSPSETSKSVPYTSSLLQLVHGTCLKNMPLDCFTLTEILRIHLITSGAHIQWSTNDRKQYFLEKDPALAFKTEEADILKQLSVVSVYGLSIENRLKILKVLISQLLTYDLFRDAIEETNEKLRQTKGELRQLHINYKKEREESASLKKKSESKIKDEEKKTIQSTLAQESDGKVIVNGVVNGQGEEQSENEQPKLSPEEEELLQEKRLKEQLRKKEEYDRKVAELKSQISELQSASALLPLGRNRSYHRFWVFNSLPGLFVEDDDPFIGTCQPSPTPYNPKSNPSMFENELPLSFMSKYLQRLSDDKSTNSDKENESVEIISSKHISENVQYLKTPKLMNSKEDNVILNSNVINCKLKSSSDLLTVNENDKVHHIQQEMKFPISGMCTSCPLTCPVHGTTVKRTKWSFYYKAEELDALIASLNPRGFRERRLREILLSVKEKMLDILGKCPAHKLNKELPLPPQPEIRKSQRFLCNQPSQFASIPPEIALEQILRDTILDIEDKIYAGCLGAIKVKDRMSWRTAIELGVKDFEQEKEKELKESNSETMIDPEKVVTSSPSVDSKQKLKDLATAMLEIAQGIDPKFLKPPLGEDSNSRKQKQKSFYDTKKSKQQDDGQIGGTATPPPTKVPKSSFDKWKESVMMCSSLSQLFLYLATLEKSVQWSRSGLNARCKICRCSGDAENMLLCDGCNRGHHTYCLKPPLSEIPTGDWYCTTCKPKEKPVSPKKDKKYYEEEEEEEGDVDDDDDESEFDFDDNLDDQYESEPNEDVCDACYKGGTLICCDGCPLSFHLECVNPPLRRVPRGIWNCPKCVALATKQAAAAKHSAHNSGLYKTRAQLLLSISDKKRSRTSSPASDSGKSRRDYRGRYANNQSEENGRINRKRRSLDDEVFDYVTCDKIINLLMHHSDSWPFLRPVNKKDVPDYYKIIKKPMDLGTIRSKLNNMQYLSNKAFVADIYLVLQNCELYNPRSSVEYKAGQRLLKATENALYTYKLKVSDNGDSLHPPQKSRRTM